MVLDNTWPDSRVEREARAIKDRGYDVDVVCLREPGEPPLSLSNGTRVHRLPVRRQRGRGAGVQMLEYVAFLALATAKLISLDLRHRYTVVHVHNVPDLLVFSAIWPRLRGARIILDLHDLTPEFFESRFGRGPSSLWGRLVRLQERAATAFADHVITVTEAWRQTLIERGVPAHKVSVVMNLPDDAIFPPAPVLPASHRDPTRILYHGTFTHRYGIDLLIEAVVQARRAVPLELVIHGTGEELPALQQLAERLEAGDSVRFSTDFLPTADLPRLIRGADIGVVPYRRDAFTDGILPTKLLEYVAIGIPAIVARSSAIERHFDETMVRYFPPGDVSELARAIVELATDPEAREAMARRARAFLERHPWASMADAYVSAVEGRGSEPSIATRRDDGLG